MNIRFSIKSDRSRLFILLVVAVFLLPGCDSDQTESHVFIREPFAAMHELKKQQESQPETCCRIASEENGMEIFVNGVGTGQMTPTNIPLDPGDFVHLSTIIEPGVDVLLVTQGYNVQNGAWVVQGEEKVIQFGREKFVEGFLRLVKTGPGWSIIGFDLNKPLSQDRFAALIMGTSPLRVLYMDIRRGLTISPLKGVSSLWALDISRTDITDLSELAANKELRMLVASDSKIDDISSLKGFFKLVLLDIDNTKVKSLAPISGLGEIRVLRLRNTPVSDISPLASANKMEQLDCTSTKISDLTVLEDMKNLKSLLLASTKVTDISPIVKATALVNLVLNDTEISDLAPLRDLKSLSSLHLRHTRVSSLDPLADLHQLSELYLDGTQVEQVAPISKLRSLSKLSLAGTKVKYVKTLDQLSGLKWLSLYNTQVPKSQVNKLRKKLPDCKIISND